MTLLDYQTLSDSPTTNYFTFLPEPPEADFEEIAALDAWSELTQFETDRTFVQSFADDVDDDRDDQSGHADLATAYARCSDGAGTLTHLFFSEDNFDLARAKAICSKCRLAPTCLADALDREEPYGVWGGELLVSGVIVAAKRGRGRPPKLARLALQVDEVPLPPHLVA